MIEEIFIELVKEAANGAVVIDLETWPIAFNTCIENDKQNFYMNEQNLSTLVINDKEQFYELLTEYIMLELNSPRKIPRYLLDNEKDKIKYIMAYLFVNATVDDFTNPCAFIKRRMSFLNDDTFSYLNQGIEVDIGTHFFDSKLAIKNSMHSIAMETPYKIDIILVNEVADEKVRYDLATVTYGIAEENGEKVCYIYSLMKPKRKKVLSKEDEYFDKKVARKLYKLNDGIERYEMNEYFDYREGNFKYYPEGNITDVTPSFVLSLNVFMSLLQKEMITKVKGVPYLPLRYLSRDLTANSYDEDKKYQLKLRNDSIQENVTNKFVRTFRRLEFHNPDMHIVTYPYEASEFLEINLKSKEHMINNQILEDIATAVCDYDDILQKGSI